MSKPEPGSSARRLLLAALQACLAALVVFCLLVTSGGDSRCSSRHSVWRSHAPPADDAVAVMAGVLQWGAAIRAASSQPWPPPVGEPKRVPTQQPLADSNVTALAALTRSTSGSVLTPDRMAAALELQSRLVVGIACAVHGGSSTQLSSLDVSGLPLIATTLASLLPTVETGYAYRLFLAYDEVDPVYGNASVRAAVEAASQQALAAEDGQRWHPPGYQHGSTIDPSALLVSLHWVSCNYTGKPAWAQNDAAMAAFAAGADYVLRTNDDTQLPGRADWVSALISDLRGRQPVPNLGVVGPACSQGNTAILTHDFVHRTHILVHGFYYPRSFPAWYADDWITRVYSGYTQPPLLVQRDDVRVVHKLSAQRYSVTGPANITDVLQQEVQRGRQAIRLFAAQHFGVQVPA